MERMSLSKSWLVTFNLMVLTEAHDHSPCVCCFEESWVLFPKVLSTEGARVCKQPISWSDRTIAAITIRFPLPASGKTISKPKKSGKSWNKRPKRHFHEWVLWEKAIGDKYLTKKGTIEMLYNFLSFSAVLSFPLFPLTYRLSFFFLTLTFPLLFCFHFSFYFCFQRCHLPVTAGRSTGAWT